jgi:uncharacterized membrane protein
MKPLNDKQIETLIGQVLRAGMVISCTVTLIGMALYLWQSPDAKTNYHSFHPGVGGLFPLKELFPHLLHGNPIALIQLGILLLIATPVARVVFLVFAFAEERDRMYVAVSGTVLAVLLYSLVFFR